MVGPDVTAVGKNAGNRVQAIFHADAGVINPFPFRFEAAAATTEDVRSEAGRTDGPAENEFAECLVDEVVAIRRHFDVSGNANVTGEEIINAGITTPFAGVTNIRFE